MTNKIFVFDTYAILEIIGGNESYVPYLDSKIIINDFIFSELCYKLIRENHSNADYYIGLYSPYVVKLDIEVIKEAMKFRTENKKKKLSMTDCVSYFMAKNLGVKFLTGDKEFESLEGVEFVK